MRWCVRVRASIRNVCMAVASTSKPAEQPSDTWRSRIPPWWVCLLIVFFLAVIPIVQNYQERIEEVIPLFDGAVANIVSLIGGFLAFMTLYIWLSWWSSYSFQTRRAAFYLPLIGVAIAIAVLRYEGVDGYMKP